MLLPLYRSYAHNNPTLSQTQTNSLKSRIQVSSTRRNFDGNAEATRVRPVWTVFGGFLGVGEAEQKNGGYFDSDAAGAVHVSWRMML